MKKFLMLLTVPILILFSGCATTGLNNSEKAINNVQKDFIVLGNLRVSIGSTEYLYDKVMDSAIRKYGNGVDIINIKKDVRDGTGETIINCLVIKYDNHLTKQDFGESISDNKVTSQLCDCYKALNDGTLLSDNCQKIFQKYSFNTVLGRAAFEKDVENCE